jgi:guanosine-3',5'-bis(diphosphate) 3'-pyrophosphohydrolase
MNTLAKVMQAAVFAATQHQYQRRAGYDRLPYINHLLKVTDLLIQLVGKDETLLLAAILHDIIEDTSITSEELSKAFGPEVSSIVVELTDDMSLPYHVRKQKQVDTAKQLSYRAKLIRLADKDCNIQDIFSYPIDWSRDKKIAYLTNAELIAQQLKSIHPALEEHLKNTILWAKKQPL